MNQNFARAILLGCALAGAAASQAALLPAVIDLAQQPGSEGTPFTRTNAGAGDAMGVGNQTIAVADFNGDGLDDFAIGYAQYAPAESGGTQRGRVVIVYGGGTPTETNLDELSAKTTIENLDDNAQFGYAVSAGDVTGDGKPDLVVGAPGARSSRGVAVVIENEAIAAPSTVEINTDQTEPTSGETRYVGVETGSLLGYSVVCANTNPDAAFEIAMGAPGSTVGVSPGSGKVYAVFPGNFVSGMTLNVTDEAEVFEASGAPGSALGSALTAGDIDGNGIAEIVAGAPQFSENSGAVYGLFSVFPGPSAIDLGDNGSLGSVLLLTGYASLGFSLDTGDANNDGFEDILMGVPLYAPTVNTVDAGGGVLFAGRANLEGVALDVSSNVNSGLQIIKGGSAGERVGASVALGDINGNGLDDVLLGAPFADAFAGTTGDFGVVYAITSTLNLEGFGAYELEFIDASVAIHGRLGSDFSGAALNAKGDLNADGFADLISTAAFASNTPQDGTGVVYTLYGDGLAESAAATKSLISGDTLREPLGGPQSPVLRASVDFTGGDGGRVSAVLTRNTSGLSNVGNGFGTNLAPVYWNLTTTRTGWTAVEISLQYLDLEVDGFDEAEIALYQAPAPEGPWTRVAGQTLDAPLNQFSFSTDALGSFAIVAESPVITLLGNAEIDLECEPNIVVPGATAVAADGTDLTDQIIVNGVDFEGGPGEYEISYDVTDEFNNAAATVTRVVQIVDTTAPEISVDGDFFINVDCGSAFAPTYSATDACSGDLTERVTIGGDIVDTTTPGSYEITFDVSDPAGNPAATVERRVDVSDSTPPELTLEGDNFMSIACGSDWVDPGYTATDTCDGDVSGLVEVSGDEVDPTTAGFYTITYQAFDGTNNAGDVQSRTVQVTGLCGAIGTFDDCPNDSIIVQPPDDGTGAGGIPISEQGDNLVFETFRLDPNEPISTVTWWGYGTDANGTVCTRAPNVFELTFYSGVSGAGGFAPNLVKGTYTLTPLTEATGFTDAFNRPVNRYTAELDPPMLYDIQTQFSVQFLSIAGLDNPDCRFNWYYSPEGDDRYRTGADFTNTIVQEGGDLAFCLGRAPEVAEGEGATEGEGQADGEGEGEAPLVAHSADWNGDAIVNLTELLRLVQLYNLVSFGCGTVDDEDGFSPYGASQSCPRHNSDYAPANWIIELNELLRLIQLYNAPGYRECPGEEDGYCPNT